MRTPSFLPSFLPARLLLAWALSLGAGVALAQEPALHALAAQPLAQWTAEPQAGADAAPEAALQAPEISEISDRAAADLAAQAAAEAAPALPAGGQSLGAQDFVRNLPALPLTATAEAAPPSADAQQTYQAARDKLVQIRTLRRATNTQSSIGSGAYVDASGLILTNFHVISDLALAPDKHRGVSVSMAGQETEVALLAFDVLHDLAVLRPVQPPAEGVPALALRPPGHPLAQGERIYSLGNPLDVGFAITEGTYNGLVQRSFYPRIFFGGALNPGMSGGPALDAQSRVIGVNVAKRMDAEQVSFLVPVEFARRLIEQARSAQPMQGPAHAEITRQLMQHQQTLTERLLAAAPRSERYGRYTVPLPPEEMSRCWGDGQAPEPRNLFHVESSQCSIDSGVYTGERASDVGSLQLRYEAYDAPRLHPLAFARQYSSSFASEPLNWRGSAERSAAECRQSFVRLKGMDARVVLCMRAYRKFTGLHDLMVLAVSLNQPTAAVLGRMDVTGLSFDNAMRLSRHFLDGFAWEESAP